MDLAYLMMREEQRLFDTSSCELIENYQEATDVKQYVRGMQDWVMGNMFTYQNLSRYTKANNEAAAKFTLN